MFVCFVAVVVLRKWRVYLFSKSMYRYGLKERVLRSVYQMPAEYICLAWLCICFVLSVLRVLFGLFESLVCLHHITVHTHADTHTQGREGGGERGKRDLGMTREGEIERRLSYRY